MKIKNKIIRERRYDLSFVIILMLTKTKNGTLLNHILSLSKNQLTNDGLQNSSYNLRLPSFENLRKNQRSVQIYTKRSQKSISESSILDLKQQIRKLRTQSVHLNYSPLTNERSTSCVKSAKNKNVDKEKTKNNLLQIIKVQSLVKSRKTKDLLPRITLNNDQKEKAIIKYPEDPVIESNISQINESYPIFSVVRVQRNTRKRLNNLFQSDRQNQMRNKINQPVSRWQHTQIQEHSLYELSNMK